MCGIVGFLEAGGGRPEDMRRRVGAMAARLRHRGPDDQGVWIDPSTGLALGHRRLAIVDLSPLGHQPMVRPGGRFVLAMNGEIYNFEALRQDLEELGHSFRSQSDTEVMLAAFDHWGVEAATRRFTGMFAFAAWDSREQVLWLGRDRMGEKPLYYGSPSGVFLFGSELKAFEEHPGWEAEIDRDAVSLYFRYGYIPAPRSVYQGIRKLPPACLVRIEARRGRPPRVSEPEAYWSLEEAARIGRQYPFSEGEAEAVTGLETLLGDAVRQQMVADVPLGAFLSGGIDSSTVVALMQAQSSRPVKTFTIGFREAEFNEADQARAVAHHLGTEHTELYVTPRDAMGVIPELASIYDEPFADPSAIPTLLVARLARQHVTVSLTGDGGDELFGGYPRYSRAAEVWDLLRRIPRPLGRLGAAALGGARGGRLAKLGQILALESGLEVYHRTLCHWRETPRLVAGAGGFPSFLETTPGLDGPAGLIERAMYLDSLTYLPDDILVKVDRATMAVSLESRAPLLDHRVVEFAWSLPLDYKAPPEAPKRILRRLLDRYVPPELTDRPKRGFGVPIGEWLRGPLEPWAAALLSSSRLESEGFLDPAPIEDKWAQHRSRQRSWEYDLWIVLMFQAWLEQARRAPEPLPADPVGARRSD